MENNTSTPNNSERRTTLTPQQLKAVRRAAKFLHKNKENNSKKKVKLSAKRLNFSPLNSPDVDVEETALVSSTATTIEYCSPQPSPKK